MAPRTPRREEPGLNLASIYSTNTQSSPQTHWSPRVSNEPQEEGALLRKWETVKVDSDQKATPPNALCSKTGPIWKSEQGWADPEFMEKSLNLREVRGYQECCPCLRVTYPEMQIGLRI